MHDWTPHDLHMMAREKCIIGRHMTSAGGQRKMHDWPPHDLSADGQRKMYDWTPHDLHPMAKEKCMIGPNMTFS
jgi:hypothetical protein